MPLLNCGKKKNTTVFPVRNTAAERAVGLCGLLKTPQLLIYVLYLYHCVQKLISGTLNNNGVGNDESEVLPTAIS
jgi:hypothetical protein